MGRNFKLVVTKGISAAAQIEATTEQSRHGRRQLSVDNEFHGTLTTAWSA